MSDVFWLTMSNELKIDVLEHVDDAGMAYYIEKFERLFPVNKIDHDDSYKMSCEACKKYGNNLACPPYSPSFPDYVGNAKTARVICLRLPQEYFNHLVSEERYRTCFGKARNLLVDILQDYRKEGHTVAGSGPCLACERCAVEHRSEKCRNPDKMIYSLESLGTNLITLVKKCFDIELEWSSDERYADFVCAVGAVFYKDDESAAK